MRAVIQRTSRASVTVDGEKIAEIGPGLLVLLGVENGDAEPDVEYMAAKTAGLRIFRDAEGKMNRSVVESGGQALVVSQFTLAGDCRKGRRPSFDNAADPALAERLYGAFCERLRRGGIEVKTGRFRAMMDVELVNDGPVTLLLDSRRVF